MTLANQKAVDIQALSPDLHTLMSACTHIQTHTVFPKANQLKKYIHYKRLFPPFNSFGDLLFSLSFSSFLSPPTPFIFYTSLTPTPQCRPLKVYICSFCRYLGPVFGG